MTNPPEKNLPYQKYRERAIKFNTRAKSSRWIVCVECLRVVGNYIPGETSGLAADLGIDVSQVQNLALAAKTWLELRKWMAGGEVEAEMYPYLARARRKLSPSHFVVLGRAIKKYDMNTGDALDQLITAVTSGASVRQFAMLLEHTLEDEKPPEWARNTALTAKYAARLLDDYGTPDKVREIARQFVDVSVGASALPFITLERAVCVYLRAVDKVNWLVGKGMTISPDAHLSWVRRRDRALFRVAALVQRRQRNA